MSEIPPHNSLKETKKGLTSTNLILIVGFLVVLVVIGIVGFFIYNSLNKNSSDMEVTPFNYGNAYLVDEDNLVEMQAKAEEEVQEGLFLTTMNVQWDFPSGKEASTDAYVGNDPNNKRAVYIEVTLNDTSELVYKSSIIPVGSALKTIKLNKNLQKGAYPAVCTYHLVNDEGEVTSSLAVEVTINILN